MADRYLYKSINYTDLVSVAIPESSVSHESSLQRKIHYEAQPVWFASVVGLDFSPDTSLRACSHLTLVLTSMFAPSCNISSMVGQTHEGHPILCICICVTIGTMLSLNINGNAVGWFEQALSTSVISEQIITVARIPDAGGK